MEWNVVISILLVGVTIVLAIVTKFGFRLLSLPAISGYFILGILIRVIGEEFNLYSAYSADIFYFLSNLGIIALLFRIGLESKLVNLLKWLPKALFIWVGDVLLSGMVGFLVSYQLLDLHLIPSLFIAAAFTATSVGISVAVWKEMEVLDTTEGQVMLDTAELDDLSGILIMGILFAIAPILQQHAQGAEVTGLVLQTAGLFLLNIVLFTGICLFIALFAQKRLSQFLNKLHAGDSEMLVVLGLGLMVASIAAMIGFSVAIGAFFAGLIFSNNPEAVKIDASFEAVYELFVPFFFVGIGLTLDLSVLSVAVGPALVLLVAAVLGKFLGAGLPAMATLNKHAGLIIGLSMIPRAEIALIIVQRGTALGDWAVNSTVFAYIVIISMITTLLMPLVLRAVMQRKSINLQRA